MCVWLVCLILARFSFYWFRSPLARGSERARTTAAITQQPKRIECAGVRDRAIQINEELNLILSMHLGFVNVFKYNKLNVRGEHIAVDSLVSVALARPSVGVVRSKQHTVPNEWRVHWGWYLFRRLLKWLYVHANCWGNININLQNQPHKMCCVPKLGWCRTVEPIRISRWSLSERVHPKHRRSLLSDIVSDREGRERERALHRVDVIHLQFHLKMRKFIRPSGISIKTNRRPNDCADGWRQTARHLKFTTPILIPFICPSKIQTPFALIAYFSTGCKIKVLSGLRARHDDRIRNWIGDFSQFSTLRHPCTQQIRVVGERRLGIWKKKKNEEKTMKKFNPSRTLNSNFGVIFCPYAF